MLYEIGASQRPHLDSEYEKIQSMNTQDRWIIGSLLLSSIGVVSAALLKDPRPIGISVFVIVPILILAWYQTGSTRLGWLLIFGAVAGFGELWADWIHVEYFHSLAYLDYFGLKLLASPLYMPFGWWITVVQFGYLAFRIAERSRNSTAILIITVLGMLLPPWYEQFAAPARAWYYTPHGMMLSHTPLWIIFTYGGCMFSIASAALLLYQAQSWTRAIIAGIFASASFMFWAAFWFAIIH
jgi:hypothetical protein